MKLHDPQPNAGSHKLSRRLGRGHGSGRGKTAGRGTKGQKSRAGGGIPAWFEGGQTPLHVRTPKLHGFKNRFRVEYAGLNLGRFTDAEAGTLITPDVLRHDRLLRDQKTRPMPVKILGGGDAPRGVTVHAHAFTGPTGQRARKAAARKDSARKAKAQADAEAGTSEANPESGAPDETGPGSEPESDAETESSGEPESES